MAYELIETVTVGSGGASSIEFTSIPQDGTDLVLKASARMVSAGDPRMTINNNSGSIYAFLRLQGAGGGNPTSVRLTNRPYLSGWTFPNIGDAADTFSNTEIYFANYTSSATKSISIDSVEESDVASPVNMEIWAGNADDTNPITSIEIFGGTDDLAEHSTFSLYKITAA